MIWIFINFWAQKELFSSIWILSVLRLLGRESLEFSDLRAELVVVEILVVFIAQVHDQVLIHCEVAGVDTARLSNVLDVLIFLLSWELIRI